MRKRLAAFSACVVLSFSITPVMPVSAVVSDSVSSHAAMKPGKGNGKAKGHKHSPGQNKRPNAGGKNPGGVNPPNANPSQAGPKRPQANKPKPNKPGKNKPNKKVKGKGKPSNVRVVYRTRVVEVPGPVRFRTRSIVERVPFPVYIRVPEDRVVASPAIAEERTVTDTIIRAVGIGTLGILAFLALLLVGLWLGYVLGYRDSDKKNTKFMAVLSDSLMIRRPK